VLLDGLFFSFPYLNCWVFYTFLGVLAVCLFFFLLAWNHNPGHLSLKKRKFSRKPGNQTNLKAKTDVLIVERESSQEIDLKLNSEED
jgi:hypothetical protein